MSTAPRPFSIRFILPDGTPDGMKIVEKSNWIGRAISCPRANFAALRERPEFKKTGVYLLIGQATPDDLPTVYIGEGDPVGDRLVQHQKQRDFWSSLIFFTSKDDNLNKAHVQYLESRLIALAREAKRCVLENGTAPALPSLSEADVAEMQEFFDQMILMLPVLGTTVFQKPGAATDATQLLYLKSRGLTATGYEAADGFVVLAGSQTPKSTPGLSSPAFSPIVMKTRNHLVNEGLLEDAGECFRLAQDYTFNSPSLAATVMLGRGANGRTEWKDAQGRSLKEIQADSAAGAASA